MLRKTLVSLVTAASLTLSLDASPSHAESLASVQSRLTTPGRAYAHCKIAYAYIPDPFGPLYLPASKTVVWSYMDYMLTPEDFHERRGGDCEDYANFNTHALKTHGYDARTIIITGIKNAHAICLIKENDGTYTYLGNDKFRKHLRTVEDAISVYDKHWTKYGEMIEDKDSSDGYVVKWIKVRATP